MPDIQILKAEYNNLEEILNLQKIAFLSEAKLYNNYSFEAMTQTLESIQNDFNDYTFLKAELDNKIIGSVKGKNTNGICWIGRLMVHPDFQNQGIAKRLISAIESEIPDVTEYLLFTGSKSIKNIRLYESVGYEKIEEFQDLKNPDIILIKMKKDKV